MPREKPLPQVTQQQALVNEKNLPISHFGEKAKLEIGGCTIKYLAAIRDRHALPLNSVSHLATSAVARRCSSYSMESQ
jgi:hypothetical protein